MTDSQKTLALAVDNIDPHGATVAMATQPGEASHAVRPSVKMTPPTDTFQPEKPALPLKVAKTTPPKETFQRANLSNDLGGLVYWPALNAFLALYPDEMREVHAVADEHAKKIKALQEANQKVTEVSLALRNAQKSGVKADIDKEQEALKAAINEMRAASDEVKKKLEPLSKLDAKNGVKMVELVSLKTKDYDKKGVPIYVTSKSLDRALADKRIYMVSGEKAKRIKEGLHKDGKLNTVEIKHRIAETAVDKAKFEKKWKLKPEDADEYSGILTEWAKHMNGDITGFLDRGKEDLEKRFNIDPKDPKRMVDLSAEAQLMRYSAGAGLGINFKAFQGNMFDQRDGNWAKRLGRGMRTAGFGVKANAEASFSLAEGKVGTEIYLPHFAGWHAEVDVGEQHFELGYWRFYANVVLSAGVGASLAIETEIGITVEGGKQGVHGIPPENRDKAAVKARAGASASLDVFAGATAGATVKGALQWLNPEGPSKNGKPVAVKAGKAIAEYNDMATVDAGVNGNAGAGVTGAFKIAHENGKFVIYAKIGACLGLGGKGSLKFEADTKTIGEFFKCVAYQLKRADFHKINDAIDKAAYTAYCQVKYIVIVKRKQLEDFAEQRLDELENDFNLTVEKIDSAISAGTNEAAEFLENIKHEIGKKTEGWFSYAPPEVAGKILWQIHNIGIGGSQNLRAEVPSVMQMALGAPQTENQLQTVAERMTSVMGDKQDARVGFAMINQTLFRSEFDEVLVWTKSRLAGLDANVSNPFIWNSDPEFVRSTIDIEHPMYS